MKRERSAEIIQPPDLEQRQRIGDWKCALNLDTRIRSCTDQEVTDTLLIHSRHETKADCITGCPSGAVQGLTRSALPIKDLYTYILNYLDNPTDIRNARLIEKVASQIPSLIQNIEWNAQKMGNLSQISPNLLNNIRRINIISSLEQLEHFPNLTHLKFGESFNQPLQVDGVNVLPDSLTHLTFGRSFNQPLQVDGVNVLPYSLTHLQFKYKSDFHQPLQVDGVSVLPDSLTHFTFGYGLHQLNFPQQLPNSLVSLKILGHERIQHFRQDAGSNYYHKYQKYKNKYLRLKAYMNLCV